MAVFLSPVGGVAAQFFTNTGAVLTGGKLYTYAAGTTTPATTFTNSGGVVANTNPIVLDAAGRVPSSGEIWLADNTQYKFVLKDSNDVLIATYDNISGINSNFTNFLANQEIYTATAGQTVFTLANPYTPGANTLSVFVDGVNQYGPGAQYAYVETNTTTVTFVSGLHVGASVKFTTVQSLTSTQATTAALVSYNEGDAGAVTYSVQSRLRQIVTVKDFGAVGDGTTDDTLAIQAALNTGKTVYIPDGIYKITSALTVTGNSRFIYGNGANSVIKPFGAINAIEVGNGTDAVNLGKISGICIQAGTTTVLRGIYMRNAREFDLSDITIFGIDDSNRSFVNQAIFCTFCWRCNFTSVYGLYITGDGIVLGTGAVGTECNAITFTGCKMNRLTGTAYAGYGAGHTLSGCSAESCTGGGALFQYVAGLAISGGYFEQCGAANLGHTIKIGASQNAGSITGVYIASSGLTNHRAIELDTMNGLFVSGVNFTGLTGAGSYGIYTGASVTNVVALANINEAGTPGVLYGGSSYPGSFIFDGANLNYGASIGLGSTITKYISTTATLTPTAIPSVPGYLDIQIAVPGAVVGDTVTVGGPVTALVTLLAYVPTGGNAVNVRFMQLSGAAATPVTGTYRVDVWQH